MNVVSFVSMVQAVYEGDAELFSSFVGTEVSDADLSKIRDAMEALEEASYVPARTR